jgi:hypothetical protein
MFVALNPGVHPIALSKRPSTTFAFLRRPRLVVRRFVDRL